MFYTQSTGTVISGQYSKIKTGKLEKTFDYIWLGTLNNYGLLSLKLVRTWKAWHSVNLHFENAFRKCKFHFMFWMPPTLKIRWVPQSSIMLCKISCSVNFERSSSYIGMVVSISKSAGWGVGVACTQHTYMYTPTKVISSQVWHSGTIKLQQIQKPGL